METFSALLALCAGNSSVPVNSPHKGQWRGALMFSLVCARMNDWVNNREAGDLRRHRGHYDVSVMQTLSTQSWHVWSWSLMVMAISGVIYHLIGHSVTYVTRIQCYNHLICKASTWYGHGSLNGYLDLVRWKRNDYHYFDIDYLAETFL